MSKRSILASMVASVIVAVTASEDARASGWVSYPTPGCATAIASASDGNNYAIGCGPADANGNYGIFSSAAGHKPWVAMPGRGIQIAAAYHTDDFVTVVNNEGQVYYDYQWTSGFVEYPNPSVSATTIAAWNDEDYSTSGSSGVWVTGGNWTEGGGWQIFHRTNNLDGTTNGTSWTQVSGAAVKLAMDPYGVYPWAINAGGYAFKWNPSKNAFANAPVGVCATDIAVTESSSDYDDVWVVGCYSSPGPYEYITTAGVWAERPMPSGIVPVNVSSAENGDTLVYDQNGNIWYYQS